MKRDFAHDCDCFYYYSYPIMVSHVFHCPVCHKSLRKVPKEHIVKAERYWSHGEPHFERAWYCSKDCARAEYQRLTKGVEEEELTEVEKLNHYIMDKEVK